MPNRDTCPGPGEKLCRSAPNMSHLAPRLWELSRRTPFLWCWLSASACCTVVCRAPYSPRASITPAGDSALPAAASASPTHSPGEELLGTRSKLSRVQTPVKEICVMSSFILREGGGLPGTGGRRSPAGSTADSQVHLSITTFAPLSLESHMTQRESFLSVQCKLAETLTSQGVLIAFQI